MEHVLWTISDSENVKGPLSFTVKNVIKHSEMFPEFHKFHAVGTQGGQMVRMNWMYSEIVHVLSG